MINRHRWWAYCFSGKEIYKVIKLKLSNVSMEYSTVPMYMSFNMALLKYLLLLFDLKFVYCANFIKIHQKEIWSRLRQYLYIHLKHVLLPLLKVTGVGQGHPEEDLQEGRGKDIDQDLYHPGWGTCTCSIFVFCDMIHFIRCCIFSTLYTYNDSQIFNFKYKKMHWHSVSGFPLSWTLGLTIICSSLRRMPHDLLL